MTRRCWPRTGTSRSAHGRATCFFRGHQTSPDACRVATTIRSAPACLAACRMEKDQPHKDDVDQWDHVHLNFILPHRKFDPPPSVPWGDLDPRPVSEQCQKRDTLRPDGTAAKRRLLLSAWRRHQGLCSEGYCGPTVPERPRTSACLLNRFQAPVGCRYASGHVLRGVPGVPPRAQAFRR